MPVYIEKINGDVNQPTNWPTDQQGEYRAICLFRKLENRKKAEICNFDISIFLSEAGLLNFSDFSGEFSENSYPIQYEYSIFVFSVLLEFCLSPKLFVPLASSANKLFGPPKCLVLLPRQPRYLISRNGFTLFLSSKVCIGSDRVKLSPFPLDFLGARMPQSVQPWNHVGKNKLHLPCEIWTNNHLCYKLAHPSDPNNL